MKRNKRYKLLMLGSILLVAVALPWGMDQAQAGPGAVLDPPLYPNGRATYYANSPAGTNYPIIDPATGLVVPASNSGTAMRKFVDSLPGLGLPGCDPSTTCNANNLGQYIPIANPDTTTYSGSDYYEIGLKDYRRRMHQDLPLTTDALGTGTRLRGYYQINNGNGLGLNTDHSSQYLGPLILANKNRPVRLKFVNQLGTGSAGNLFLPVDTTAMGAGLGPDGVNSYTQNRATIHLHGGLSPWISDGTPHQWITPAGDPTPYKQGLSVVNVPDMLPLPVAGDGTQTFYYTNQQSARLMFYHDHAYGITRLNVYAGEAAGYLLTDQYEEDLISGTNVTGINPGLKQAIPGAAMPTEYHWGIPLVIQDKSFVPADVGGLGAPYGQDTLWDTVNWGVYGDLWFPHVYEINQDLNTPSGLNPAGRWDYGPWVWPPTAITNYTMPHPSIAPEAFMDTAMVNGAAYPYLPVERKAYRFRVLSVGNDRAFNLQLYYAVDAATQLVKCDNATVVGCTEVKMIPALDGRDGGIPDPANAGPSMIQIGTEGGFLPAPVVLANTPIDYGDDGNVTDKTLLLQPAERADVIIDFSGVPDGSTIILYNDAPSAFPGGDSRYDYYTGNDDQTESGGAPSTLAGYGPNTRTIMQFRVSGAQTINPNLLTDLQALLPVTFNASQEQLIVPANTYAKLLDTSMTVNGINYPFKGKSINEGFESTYGRIFSTLGLQNPDGLSAAVPLEYTDPTTETLAPGEVQLWKIIHNGMDTHPMHFHLLNVQVVNRVGWDGSIRPPDANELGWKETVRMNPQEDIIVAFKVIAPVVPFTLPNSIRPLDVTMPVSATNPLTNFGHEYVWHCHILGHEEFDLMRPLVFNPNPKNEICWRNTSTGQNLFWYLDEGAYTGSGTLPTVNDPNWAIVGRGDFNNDGDLDILWRNTTTGQNGVWYLDGTTFMGFGWLPDVGALNWTIVGTGDFNSDRKVDILWRNTTTGQNVVWYLDGITFMGFGWLPAVSNLDWTIAGTGDFNNDGKVDLLWRDTTTGQSVAWYLDGITFTGFGWLPTVSDLNWRIVGVGDYNNDVNTDVLWRNASTGQNVVWNMNGTTVTGLGWLPTVSDLNWQVVGH